MKLSSNSLPSKQSSQDISRQVQISAFNKHVYRYSYNLGLPEFRAHRKENATIFPASNYVEIRKSKSTHDYSDLGKLQRRHERQKKTVIPTLIDVAPASKTQIINEWEKEKAFRVHEEFCTNEMPIAYNCGRPKLPVCSSAYQKKSKDLEESTEVDTARRTNFAASTQEDCVTSGYEKDRGFNAEFLPPTENFGRAARVLGVCLPPKELHPCLQRQKGVCEDNESCSLEHRTLLRILNKRF